MSQVIIEVELTSGRYHAHVWGEAQYGMGEPEWPPSSWRLLRAIASAWFSATPPPCEAELRNQLLEALGLACPPTYLLPRVKFQELRYFQPITEKDGVITEKRKLHHDHFAVLQKNRLYYLFNVNLTKIQHAALGKLLSRLRYFGRAESRATLRLCGAHPENDDLFQSKAHNGKDENSSHHMRPVLCPSKEPEERRFQASDLWMTPRPLSDSDIETLNSKKVDDLKKLCRERYLSCKDEKEKLVERLRKYHEMLKSGCSPIHLVDVLLDRKQPLPEGCRWVNYMLPKESIVWEMPARKATPTRANTEVRIIRFRLCRRIPLPLIDTVTVARAFRDKAVSKFRLQTGEGHSTTLTGRDADGNVCRGHRHAYYLPKRSGASPYLDELSVVIPEGTLSAAERDAILSVGHLRLRASDPYPVTVVHELTPSDNQDPIRSCCWRAITPFLPPRRGRRGRAARAVEKQLIELAEQLNKPNSPSIEVKFQGCIPIRCHEYATRNGRWHLTRRIGFYFKLTSEEPFELPFPIGPDAHFGLGQFEPGTLQNSNPLA